MVTPESQSTHLPDRYTLLDPLGRGGMGVVWLADDAVLQRKVAIKEVHVPADVDAGEAESLRARVMREARAAGRLNHPNVTTIYDVARDEQRTWIVMEYVDAPTLTEVVSREGPLDEARAAGIGLAVLSALEAAHAQGIVHRDVKPGNVMVPADGNVKLADFGVAAVQGDPKLTMTGLIVGSPSYMSPEQAQEGQSTEATDMWGLGATLYYAIEGVPPFDRGATIPTLAAVTHEPPRQMTRGGTLEPLLLDLLSKDPAQRPALDEVRQALRRANRPSPAPAAAPTVPVAPTQESDEPRAVHDDDWAGEPESPRRRSWPALLAAAALLAIAVFALPRVLDTGGADDATTRQNAGNGGGDASAQQGDEEPQADDEPPEDATGGVPGDWVTYDVGGTGSTVAHPQDWSARNVSSTSADITDPQGGRYLRVQYTDSPKDDAVADWEQQSQSFGARHDNYTEIGIEPYDYPGADTAALWEYTYTDGGADLHAYNLAIVIGGRGYALNFQTRQNQWDESQQLWEQFVAGFEPAQ